MRYLELMSLEVVGLFRSKRKDHYVRDKKFQPTPKEIPLILIDLLAFLNRDYHLIHNVSKCLEYIHDHLNQNKVSEFLIDLVATLNQYQFLFQCSHSFG